MYRVCYGILCLAALGLEIALGNLFTEEGVLVRRGDEARAVSGLWTVVVLIHPPPRPEFSAWIDRLERDITAIHAKGQAGVDDLQVWRDRLTSMRQSIDEFNTIRMVAATARNKAHHLTLLAR